MQGVSGDRGRPGSIVSSAVGAAASAGFEEAMSGAAAIAAAGPKPLLEPSIRHYAWIGRVFHAIGLKPGNAENGVPYAEFAKANPEGTFCDAGVCDGRIRLKYSDIEEMVAKVLTHLKEHPKDYRDGMLIFANEYRTRVTNNARAMGITIKPEWYEEVDKDIKMMPNYIQTVNAEEVLGLDPTVTHVEDSDPKDKHFVQNLNLSRAFSALER